MTRTPNAATVRITRAMVERTTDQVYMLMRYPVIVGDRSESEMYRSMARVIAGKILRATFDEPRTPRRGKK